MQGYRAFEVAEDSYNEIFYYVPPKTSNAHSPAWAELSMIGNEFRNA